MTHHITDLRNPRHTEPCATLDAALQLAEKRAADDDNVPVAIFEDDELVRLLLCQRTFQEV